MNYPENFLRGISNKTHVTPDGAISSAAFYFDQQHITDDWMEQSICWEDDDSVISLMMKQKKESDIQFKAGVVRVPRGSISYINRLPMYRALLAYERKRLEDNPYHGNLLLKKDTNKGKMKIVAAMIAGHVSDFFSQ